jgi:hypothetical protein
MPEATAPNPQSDADQLDAAADQAIAACGGNDREAVKALLVANENEALRIYTTALLESDGGSKETKDGGECGRPIRCLGLPMRTGE